MASTDPRVAYHIDGRVLLGLLPHLPQEDLHTIRQDFAAFLTRPPRSGYASWQDGWNAWTRASTHRPGAITYRPIRCHACHGRGFDHRNLSRNLARTGNISTCGECHGTRRGQMTHQAAKYAAPPAQGEQA